MIRIFSAYIVLAIVCGGVLAAWNQNQGMGIPQSNVFSLSSQMGGSFNMPGSRRVATSPQGNPTQNSFLQAIPSFPRPGLPLNFGQLPESGQPCHQNEIRMTSGCAPTFCTEGCRGSNIACSMVCTAIPVSGVCACKPGYKRISDGGECVLEAICNTANYLPPFMPTSQDPQAQLQSEMKQPQFQQQQIDNQQQPLQLQSQLQKQVLPNFQSQVLPNFQGQVQPNFQNLIRLPPRYPFPPQQGQPCGPNEVRRFDGCLPNACTDQCPNSSNRMCNRMCQSVPAEGVCVCAPNNYRASDGGPCVPLSQCSSNPNSPNQPGACRMNEVFRTDVSCLPNTCTAGCPDPRARCACNPPPPQGVCVCQTGYVLIVYNGFQVCVPNFVCGDRQLPNTFN